MIIYGCINGKLNNKNIDDISTNKANSILKEKTLSLNHYQVMVT